MSKTRFCFAQDESAHWYCIPVSKRKRFNSLLDQGDDGCEAVDEEFSKYLTGGGVEHITFVDPKELK